MSQAMLQPGVRRREVVAWTLYDFANSGFTTVVITAIYNGYFVMSLGQGKPWATFAWTAALAVSYALILLVAPVLGAHADRTASKKRWLLVATLGCAAATAGLGWVGAEALWAAILLLIVANFFFGTSENLTAAFLPELATAAGSGRVSGWGWGVGYLGGLLTLGICLAWLTSAPARSLQAAQTVPVTLWITAAIYLLAAIPVFVWLQERAQPQWARASAGVWHECMASLRSLRHFPDLRRFLICTVAYQAGVQTVITLAAIYAQQAMGFSQKDTIVLIFLVNMTAAAGALVFGHVQDRIGHKRAVVLTLLGWLLMVGIAWGSTSREWFWVAANLAGLCLGSSQAAGRAMVAVLAPAGRQGEFFGLWGLAVKLSNIIGPITYGAITWALAGQHRVAILSTGLFFLLGLVLLAPLNMARGREAAARSAG